MTDFNTARFLDPLELLGLLGRSLKVTSVALEGVALEMEDGKSIVIWACRNCGGEESHLNFGITDGTDISST